MALVLRRYEDKSYEEIGEVLGLSIAAVKACCFAHGPSCALRLIAILSAGLQERLFQRRLLVSRPLEAAAICRVGSRGGRST